MQGLIHGRGFQSPTPKPLGHKGTWTTSRLRRQPVGDQAATCRRLPKPFYDQFALREVSLAATITSLWPNTCNLLQLARDQSPTSLPPPCNLPATTWNFARKKVADQLQAICDRGLMDRAGNDPGSPIPGSNVKTWLVCYNDLQSKFCAS